MAKRSSTAWFGFVVLLLLLAAAGWGVKACRGPGDAANPPDGTDTTDVTEPPAAPAEPGPEPDAGGLEDRRGGRRGGRVLATGPGHVGDRSRPAGRLAGAGGRDARGVRPRLRRQAAGDLVEARKLLSEALASGALSSRDAEDCRTRLDAIVATLIFSREIHPGDPYAREYRVKTGETLSAIVKRENLYVPHEGIQRINQIADARGIQPHQRLKLIQGPFDAIITKHMYTLDLYHHGMFVKSFRIGLGQNGSTPIGRWRVRDRVPRARWTPPPGSDQPHTLECGEPGYPLGKDGLWIALDGMDRTNEMVSGFGIHGTNEPNSIGRQASLGCVRLADADIALVFDLLYPGKSTVEVRP